jgi:uncharacterized membrane protein YuzA (DUF378 family)
MDLIISLFGKIQPVLEALSYIVTGATAIAVLTPTPKDDAFFAWCRKAIDFLAGNIGNNK